MIELNERKKEIFDMACKAYKAGRIDDPRYSVNSLRILAGQVVNATEVYGIWMTAGAMNDEKKGTHCKKEFAKTLADIMYTVLTIASIENIDIEQAINNNYHRMKATTEENKEG